MKFFSRCLLILMQQHKFKEFLCLVMSSRISTNTSFSHTKLEMSHKKLFFSAFFITFSCCEIDSRTYFILEVSQISQNMKLNLTFAPQRSFSIFDTRSLHPHAIKKKVESIFMKFSVKS